MGGGGFKVNQDFNGLQAWQCLMSYQTTVSSWVSSKAGVPHTAPLISGPKGYRCSFSFPSCLFNHCVVLWSHYTSQTGEGQGMCLPPMPEEFQKLIPLKLVLNQLGIDLISSARMVCTLTAESSLGLPFNYSQKLLKFLFEEKKCMIDFYKGHISSKIF